MTMQAPTAITAPHNALASAVSMYGELLQQQAQQAAMVIAAASTEASRAQKAEAVTAQRLADANALAQALSQEIMDMRVEVEKLKASHDKWRDRAYQLANKYEPLEPVDSDVVRPAKEKKR